MTDTQLYLAIGLPILFNGAMFLMFQHHTTHAFQLQEKLFTEKLLRVEQVLDARLRLIEDRLNIK